MRVLILGATGMLGNVLFRYFQENNLFDTWGTLRREHSLINFPISARHKLIPNIDVLNHDELINVFDKVQPDYVINCTGLVKQLASAQNPLSVLPINSLFPHKLAKICSISQARLIHISTDCVFSGKTGSYVESDLSDAEDLYGKSKYIGEVNDLPHVVTLRTSIIGHELNSKYALVDWFLSNNQTVKGYVKTIYSGLPTIELAKIISDYVIPNNKIFGLYHVATKPINKFDLLKLIAEIYNKQITIEADEKIVLDRSLNAKRFEVLTGYLAPEWSILIEKMYQSKRFIGVQ